MVKNLKGGKGAKNLARKNVNNTETSTSTYNKIRYPEDTLEKYAVVTKMLGNGMCYVSTGETKTLQLLCHIRKKFSGRGKRNNIISTGSLVLIGLREWENPIKNSDLLCVYELNEHTNIYNHPSFNLNLFAMLNESFITSDISFNYGGNTDDVLQISNRVEPEPNANTNIQDTLINFDDI